MNRQCPPCPGDCLQGRLCPYRPQFLATPRSAKERRSDAFWLGLLALLPLAMLGGLWLLVSWVLG